ENIRNDIEEAYRSKHINVIFCTSTLMEGVNLPANNLFVTSIKNGMKNYNEIDFYNLNGRIGRLEYTMIGNVFLVIRNDKDYSRFNSLLTGSIPKQKLSVEKAINRSNIEKIKKSLLEGDITLKSIYDTESYSNSSELRKYTLIFLSDLQSNTYGIVRKNFDKYLTEAEEQTIRNKIEEKRSEEHTSELQSRFDLVCRLLLEKKNKTSRVMRDEGCGIYARRNRTLSEGVPEWQPELQPDEVDAHDS